jgi:hypothetical protein
MPAKADVTAPEECKTGHLAPRLEEAKSGQRIVFFMEAAPFVFAPFVGLVWGFERLFVQAPRGWQHCHALAALNTNTRASFTVTTLTSITSETVCALLRLLAGAHPGVPLTVGLDKAR